MSQNLFAVLLLFDIGVKTLLLLTVTSAGAFLLRKRSAATVHRWWVLGFGGCFVIPLIAFVVPSWTLPILSDTLLAKPTTAFEGPTVLGNQELPGGFGASAIHTSQLHLHERPQTPIDAGDKAGVRKAAVASVSQPVQTDKIFEFSWVKTCLAVWVVGVLVCLVRKSWQHVALLRLLNRCTKINSIGWENAVGEASQSLGLQQSISLLSLHEAQSPLTAGLLRAVVVLPGDAEDWQPARRRLVLLHELAHVKRRDVLTQTAAGLVSAFYWFNPVCWIGLVQMRKLRELACDDLVLSCGQQPTDYADVLLDVARSYRHSNYSTAVGMAHSTNVENRILAILDKARRHVSLSRTTARLLLVSAAVLVCLVGTVQLRTQAETPTTVAEQEESVETAKENPNQNVAGVIVPPVVFTQVLSADPSAAKTSQDSQNEEANTGKPQDLATWAHQHGGSFNGSQLTLDIYDSDSPTRGKSNLTNADLEFLKQVNTKSVKALYMRGHTISDEGLKHLAQLTELRILDISEKNDISSAGLKHLK